MTKRFLLKSLTIVSLLVFIKVSVLAANPVASADTIKELLALAYDIALPVVLGIGMALIAINGYKIMFSQGDPRKLAEAREGLTGAVLGLIFALLGVTILGIIISSFLGVDPGF